MTVHAAAAAPPTEEQLLIREAIRQRQRDRSGKSLAAVIALAVFFGVVGYLMAGHPGIITYGTPYSSSFPLGAVLSAFGVLEIGVAALLLAAAARLVRRHADWGDPAPGDCPLCGQATLRQDEVLLPEGSTLHARASGTVTACSTPDCRYASAQVAELGGHQG